MSRSSGYPEDFTPGAIIKGKVSSTVGDDFVVELELKSEGVLEKGEFDDPSAVKIGDEVQVLVEDVEGDTGLVKISKRKADRIINWSGRTSVGAGLGAALCHRDDFNPYGQRQARAQSCVAELSDQVKKIEGRLEWYGSLHPLKMRQQLREHETAADSLKSAISTIDADVTLNRKQHAKAMAGVGSLLNPANWFSKNQLLLRKQCKELDAIHSKQQAVKRQNSDALESLSDTLAELKSVLQEHDAFDVNRQRGDLCETQRELAKAKETLDKIASLKARVEERLSPVLEQLGKLETQISDAQSKLDRAQRIEDQLSCAGNSYQRALLHEECEEAFGISRPLNVIREQNRRLRELKRDHEKTKSRAEETGHKAARIITTVVIDGNNLCYEGDRFIGLSAVEVLLPELSKTYRVVLVFDSAIRQMLKVDDNFLRNQFGGHADVHVVAARQKADATILDSASSDPESFVLSNDRFGDYQEKRVVPRAVSSGMKSLVVWF